jgi:AcrR family transcriptional regulator
MEPIRRRSGTRVHVVPDLTAMTDRGDTRQRIMDAAFAVLREEGITAASARTIAARGDFNQALIFYHFGSVANLLAETSRVASARHVAAYAAVAGEVRSFADLVRIGRRLHAESLEEGSVAVLIQLMAASTADPDLAAAIKEGLDRWVDLVERALETATKDTPMATLFPTREAAHAVAALFLGIELMERLSPTSSEAEATLDALEGLAAVVEGLGPLVGGMLTPDQES